MPELFSLMFYLWQLDTFEYYDIYVILCYVGYLIQHIKNLLYSVQFYLQYALLSDVNKVMQFIQNNIYYIVSKAI